MNSSKITEEINPNSKDISTKNIDQILEIFNSEDSLIIEAVKNIIPDLIKIDTEGYEYEVLKGGVNTLLERNVLILFESIDLKQRQLIFEYLKLYLQ